MTELVSIAMTTYNGEKFLEKQIESIFSQTYDNIELIIVDDVSTDKTVDIINNLKNVYNIKLYTNNQNLGVLKNFEKAISKCDGEYIALADQDDLWDEEKIKILLKEIKNYSLVYTDAEIIDKYDKPTGKKFSQSNILIGMDSSNSDFFQYSIFNPIMLGSTVLFKSSIKAHILPIGVSSERFNHDGWIATVASQIDGGVHFVDKKLFKYRIHGDNTSFKKRRVKKRRGLLYDMKDINSLFDALSGCNNFNEENKKFMEYFKLNCNEKNQASLMGRIFLTYKYGKYIFATTSGTKRIMIIINFVIRG